ncbi:mycofactocin system transcriptional regulator [Propionibacterium australiense]|uniref:DNA-binding HTH domain, TetR-type n=2 Tax=Propionibacterium australiense TaxID=119981 RepID=A0A383S4I3_9ACTN|nr:TetR family transcriptional regulator [Propionibacterium australiense]RLP11300.1 TetR family transcriptional regulator [Propionibacterium australiense]SYZ32928.1 DNA-binding HTH domain, TetR-type [Propionibacterium australiense]VEH92413.1 mycofactocin system transcriptional regulator [Propionibacterium australiense]
MPRPTFFNLPEDKRSRVLAALKDEFATRTYSQASVDRITAAAGVSKGSFYQYFDDKQDAYTHLVRELMSARLGVAGSPSPEEPFEEVLTALVLGSHDFHRSDPQGWAVLARALSDDAPAVLGSDEALSEGVRRWAVTAIATGQSTGELRDDVDPGTAAWMIERVLLGVPQYVVARFGVSPEGAATDGSAFDSPEIASVAHDVVALLTAALTAMPRGGGGR